MLDEILDVALQRLFDLLPDVVLHAIALLTGAAATLIGAMMIGAGESIRIGGALTAIGLLLVVGVLTARHR